MRLISSCPMGEIDFRGHSYKWLKKPGDKVQRDEPLFEISPIRWTLKFPPAAGILQDIRSPRCDGSSQTVVGKISAEGESVAAKPAPATAVKPESDPAQTSCAAESKPAAQSSQEEAEEDHAPLRRWFARSRWSTTWISDKYRHWTWWTHHQQDITAFLERSQASPAASTTPLLRLPRQVRAPALRFRFHSGRSGAHDPDGQDHRPAHDRIVRTSAHVHCMFEVD